jgi:hypothetical protein
MSTMTRRSALTAGAAHLVGTALTRHHSADAAPDSRVPLSALRCWRVRSRRLQPHASPRHA